MPFQEKSVKMPMFADASMGPFNRYMASSVSDSAASVPSAEEHTAGCAKPATLEPLCNDQPSPLPDSIANMCSGAGGPYSGCSGAASGCEYYRWRYNDFIERHRGCPRPAPPYYLEYGEKYCNRFTQETAPNLSPEGQVWLAKTRCALQRSIEEVLKYPRAELDPQEFKTAAFDGHPDAYLNSGMADLPVWDLGCIANTPDYKELLDRATWKQIFQVAPEVIDKKTGGALTTIGEGGMPYPY